MLAYCSTCIAEVAHGVAEGWRVPVIIGDCGVVSAAATHGVQSTDDCSCYDGNGDAGTDARFCTRGEATAAAGCAAIGLKA